MKLLVHPSKVRGELAVPGSKSHTIRALTAGMLCCGRSVLRAPLDSADTRSALEAVRSLGGKVAEFPDRWELTGTGGICSEPGGTVDMGNSGTGLRLLTALAALQKFPVRFDGDGSLRSRGMASLLVALQALGADVSSANGHCPLTVKGPLQGGCTRLDGKTSQFLTALLLTLPAAPQNSVIELDFLYEQPYIGITMQWLKLLGIRFRNTPDLLHWEIPGNQVYQPFDKVIPADFSTACFPLAAAAVTGGDVVIRNLDFSDAQGDKEVFPYFEKFGVSLSRDRELRACGPEKLHGCTLDINATPDALPILAVAGSLAQGETRLLNVAQARLKETDRIAVMTEELRKMGAEIEELPDGMILHGTQLHGAVVKSHADHRIAMALAIAGMAAAGETTVEGAEAASVSWPQFFEVFSVLGADFRLLN